MILVTGGTGLVGAHLLYQLLLKNDTVKAIHRKNSDLEAVKKVFSFFSDDFESLFNKINWIEADINDVFALEIAFENVTKVYHCAALISFNPKDYKLMRRVNIEGTANIVNFSIEKKVKKLCFVSSIAAVGKSLNGNFIKETNEWDIEQSNYGYAISKYGAEMEVWRASQEGVPVVIVNPGVILGAGFWNNGSGKLFSKVYSGLKFYSEGITGYVSVNDVVKSMLQLMNGDIENQRYILVAENRSFKSVFSEMAQNFNKKPPCIRITFLMSSIAWRTDWLICKISGKNPLLTKHTVKSIHQKRYFSSEKIIKDLNFEFEPVDSAIKKTCSLFKK